jgi:hypothetical protein
MRNHQFCSFFALFLLLQLRLETGKIKSMDNYKKFIVGTHNIYDGEYKTTSRLVI